MNKVDAKYQDLHICPTHYYNADNVKRQIKISLIAFNDDFVTIFYDENNIKYEMNIPYTELERKAIIID